MIKWHNLHARMHSQQEWKAIITIFLKEFPSLAINE